MSPPDAIRQDFDPSAKIDESSFDVPASLAVAPVKDLDAAGGFRRNTNRSFAESVGLVLAVVAQYTNIRTTDSFALATMSSNRGVESGLLTSGDASLKHESSKASA